MQKNNLGKNSLYNIIGGVVRLGLGILTIPILIRSLGTEQYGIWSLAIAVISIMTLAESGLSMATTVFLSQDISRKDEKSLCKTLTSSFLLVVLAATISAVLLWKFSNSIIQFFPQLTVLQLADLDAILRVGSLLVWFRIVQQVLIGIEQAHERYDLINIVTTVMSILTSAGVIVISIQDARLIDLMKLQIFSAVIMFVTHTVVAVQLLEAKKLYALWDFDRILDLGKYGCSLWLNNFGSTAFTKLDRVIVGSILGSDGLGVYSGITDVASQINVLSSLPVQPIVPLVSKSFGQPSLIWDQVGRSLKTNTTIAVLMCACFIMFSDECVNLLFPGHASNAHILPFRIAIVIYAAYSLNAVGYYTLLASSSPGLCAVIVLFSGILSLSLITVFSSQFGLVGAVFGNAGYLVTLSLCFVAFKKLNMSFKTLICNSVLVPVVWLIAVLCTNVVYSWIGSAFHVRFILLLLEILPISAWYFSFNVKLTFN
jgi:O-antigen/teichoic acid export membrane protein